MATHKEESFPEESDRYVTRQREVPSSMNALEFSREMAEASSEYGDRLERAGAEYRARAHNAVHSFLGAPIPDFDDSRERR